MKKKLICGPLGIKMPDRMATDLSALLKTLPKECRTLRRKGVTSESSELVSGERADISMVSVESVDREGDVVMSKGVNLDFFQRNPIVTWCHQYDELPLGRAEWVKRVPGGLKAKTRYATRPDDWQGQWMADAVYSLVKEQILKGKSIGFLATNIRSFTSEETRTRPEFKDAACIESCHLLEYACCPLPVNQDSLVLAVAKGVCNQATLRRLGLVTPTVKAKAVDTLAELLKGLESIRIDPQAVCDEVFRAIANRGKV